MSQLNSIRWSLTLAAAEFSIDRRSLQRCIAVAGLEPGNDGKFSTQQICTAVFGSLESEKTRLTKAQADCAEIKRETLLKRFFPRDAVERLWNGTLILLRNKVADAEIPEALKLELLKDLKDINADEYITVQTGADEGVDEDSPDVAEPA
jgi:hypothetical protein